MNCQGENCHHKLAKLFYQYCSFLFVIFNLLLKLDFNTFSQEIKLVILLNICILIITFQLEPSLLLIHMR
jgi:hypothetical protein